MFSVIHLLIHKSFNKLFNCMYIVVAQKKNNFTRFTVFYCFTRQVCYNDTFYQNGHFLWLFVTLWYFCKMWNVLHHTCQQSLFNRDSPYFEPPKGGWGKSNITKCPYFCKNLSIVMYRKFRNVPILFSPPICPYLLGVRVGRYGYIVSLEPEGNNSVLVEKPKWS